MSSKLVYFNEKSHLKSYKKNFTKKTSFNKRYYLKVSLKAKRSRFPWGNIFCNLKNSHLSVSCQKLYNWQIFTNLRTLSRHQILTLTIVNNDNLSMSELSNDGEMMYDPEMFWNPQIIFKQKYRLWKFNLFDLETKLITLKWSQSYIETRNFKVFW